MTEWSTVAELGTAAGTLVLAVATFGATRSANRAARTAERAFEARLRPVLVQSRREDPLEKIMWGDRHWSRVPGGQGWVEATPEAVYLAMSLRNVGAGHGGHPRLARRAQPRHERRRPLAGRHVPAPVTRPLRPAERQQLLAGRLPRERPRRSAPRSATLIGRNEPFTIELLYGDLEGGQRTISRFSVVHFGDGDDPSNWLVSVVRHWNLDRVDPR